MAVACAVELLASKVHVSPEQLDVKFATGGCGVLGYTKPGATKAEFYEDLNRCDELIKATTCKNDSCLPTQSFEAQTDCMHDKGWDSTRRGDRFMR